MELEFIIKNKILAGILAGLEFLCTSTSNQYENDDGNTLFHFILQRKKIVKCLKIFSRTQVKANNLFLSGTIDQAIKLLTGFKARV